MTPRPIYLATDHAGLALKNVVAAALAADPAYTVIDQGAHSYEETDDYPDLIARAAREIAKDPAARAIIFGGSGQGEAIVANKFPHVRAVVYYGEPAHPQTDASGETIGIIASSRIHNDANVLSLGARFLEEADAVVAVRTWLATPFSGEVRHVRRIKKIEQLPDVS